jgi:carbon-monoxide dehydrogenase medium subunit
MYPTPFDYHRPKTVAEATAILRANEEAKVLAGGHSLLPAMKLRLATPAALVDIGGIKELAGIRSAAGALQIGALTTHAAVADSPEVQRGCPVLAEAAAQIGDLQVRNRGTIGGSVANADPAADYPSLLLALEAKLTAAGPDGQREIAATDFFTGLFATALAPDELLTSVSVPTYGAGTGGAYSKHRHPASYYAVVGVAALITLEKGKCARVALAVGGVMATAVRALAAEQALTGQPADEANIAQAAEKVGEAIVRPMSDVYASGDYRTHLAKVLARRALTAAAARARG